MSSNKKRIVIVGAGQAGGHASMAARKVNSEAEILLLGGEMYPPYERPPLSKAVLSGAMEIEKTFLQPVENYRNSNIEFRSRRNVLAIDRSAQRVEIEGAPSEAYDKLILTTGASARRLSIPGGAARNVFYLRSIEDSLAIRSAMQGAKTLVVVGAGLIGLEVAASAKASVDKVIVLESADRLMQRVMLPDVSLFFQSLHESRGVDLRLSTFIKAIEDMGSRLKVETSHGSIEADLVVVGIGSIPNQALAAQCGLDVNDGVVVDEFGRTSDPNISAAGDLTRHFNPILKQHIRLESWQNAQNQGLLVGRNVAGEMAPYSEVPWFWSDQFEINLQCVGWLSGADSAIYRGDREKGAFTVFYLAQDVLVGASSINSPKDVRFARILIEQKRVLSGIDLADPALKLADVCKAEIVMGAR